MQSYMMMTIVCYNNGQYQECIKYADAVWGQLFMQLNKMQCVAHCSTARTRPRCAGATCRP